MEGCDVNVGILGIGRYVLEKVVINYDLEKIMEIFDEWICMRMGIVERCIVDDIIDILYMVVEVFKKVFEDVGISGEDIDFILVVIVILDCVFLVVVCVI